LDQSRFDSEQQNNREEKQQTLVARLEGLQQATSKAYTPSPLPTTGTPPQTAPFSFRKSPLPSLREERETGLADQCSI